MDYKFLHKVLNQIVSETRMDYEKGEIQFPFQYSHYFHPNILTPPPQTFHLFTKHCKDIYGLNEQEIEYVWRVYSDDIRYKIKEEKYT